MRKNNLSAISPYIYPGLSFRPNNDLKRILLLVCQAAGISTDEIKRKCRKPKLVTARQVYCYIAKKNTTHSLREIGELVSIDHANTIHAIKKIKDLLSVNDKPVMDILNNLQQFNH
jgi:chromosomal replication initiation ATPase DnaA